MTFACFFVCECVLLLSVPRQGVDAGGRRMREREGAAEGVPLWGVRFSFVGKLLKPFAFAFAFALMCVCHCVWLHVCVCILVCVLVSVCMF